MRSSSRLPVLVVLVSPFLASLPAWSQSVPAPKAPAPAAAEGKPAEEPTIPGLVVARAGGGFLGIQTEGVVLRVTFYDKDKKKTAADAVRITTRWQDNKPRRAVLLPSAPETLSSPGVFYRPYNYVVFFALVGADEQVIETHSMMLAGSDK